MKLQDPLTRTDRILLHLACLLRGKNWRWHFNGLLRELRPGSRSKFLR